MGYRKKYNKGSLEVLQFKNMEGKTKWGVAHGNTLVSAISGYDTKKRAIEIKNKLYKEKKYVFTG